MKSIREKSEEYAKTIQQLAEEYRRKIRPLFESYSESNLNPVSAYDQDDMDKMFEAGANAVLEEIEKALNQAQYYSDMSCKNKLYEDMIKLVEQLKKG